MEGQMHINIVYCIGIGLDIESSLFQQIPFLKCALNLVWIIINRLWRNIICVTKMTMCCIDFSQSWQDYKPATVYMFLQLSPSAEGCNKWMMITNYKFPKILHELTEVKPMSNQEKDSSKCCHSFSVLRQKIDGN